MTTTIGSLPALTAAFFKRAAQDEELSERMSFADTVVHIHFTDLEGVNACTVWLDRTPIGAEVGAIGQAEVELFATGQVWMDLFVGKGQLPISIVRGDVSYSGPVRKFLRVVPLLSSFDFEMFKASQPMTGGAVRSPAS
ncbi:MAG: hypothetical protein JWO02_2582 [Solirubrobacterales bacterium]|nr:hypothetical protein [Solirubrobacterales bacterium]